MSFQQWDSARRFNSSTRVLPTDCRYVVLLHDTVSFQLEKDLQRTLKINKKPLVWFNKAFQKHRVRVEYTTCFTKTESNVLGPIAAKQSRGIVARLFEKLYPAHVQLVSSVYNVKQVFGDHARYESISIESFRDQICS